ncbi:hypothetical protein ACFE04_028643 [Oxalis oulophora]
MSFSRNSPPSSPAYASNSSSQDPTSSSDGKISSLLILIIIILSVFFFICGLLHLLVRFLFKKPSFSAIYHSNRYLGDAGSHSFQRQLQQLFRLHDSGLDQSTIDTLPVFTYKDIVGLTEPFDCAVCLSKLSTLDKLRLLPTCSHAFHITCIDTWLLSNSTCPLCRGPISVTTSNIPIDNPILNYDILSNECIPVADKSEHKINMEEITVEKSVLSVRLGKFIKPENSISEIDTIINKSQYLDGRRCYSSMGRYEYVVSDSNLEVALTEGGNSDKYNKFDKDENEDKKISCTKKKESFSVSKIWLWSKKSDFSSSSSDFGLP